MSGETRDILYIAASLDISARYPLGQNDVEKEVIIRFKGEDFITMQF